jgi:endonuclease/exonuclease/phosphatase family metal-dependent hydrolase
VHRFEGSAVPGFRLGPLFAIAWIAAMLALPACRSAPGSERSTEQITKQATAPAESLSVVSLNLWHDKRDWPKRQDMIVREMQALKPDAIVLQEVLQDAALPNQAATLAQRLGYHYRFFSVDPPQQVRRYGNAILTKVRPQHTRQAALLPRGDYRNAGWVRIEVAGRPLNVYVTHLHHAPQGGEIRAMQIHSLLEFIGSTRGDAPSVLAGDFNTAADAPELQPLTAIFADAYAAAHPGEAVNAPQHATLNPHLGHPAVRIDHVFFQEQAFRVVEARIILNQPDGDGAWPSDHYGMWAKLVRATP